MKLLHVNTTFTRKMTSFMTSPYSIRDDVTQPVIIVENFDIFLGEKSTSSVIRVTFFHFVQVRLPFNSQTDSGRGDTIISKFLTGGCVIHCIDLFSRNGFFCCTWNPPHLLLCFKCFSVKALRFQLYNTQL